MSGEHPPANEAQCKETEEIFTSNRTHEVVAASSSTDPSAASMEMIAQRLRGSGARYVSRAATQIGLKLPQQQTELSDCPATLDAFLSCPEEDVITFMSHFIAIPLQDKAEMAAEVLASVDTEEEDGVVAAVQQYEAVLCTMKCLQTKEKHSDPAALLVTSAAPEEQALANAMYDIEEVDLGAVEDVHTGNIVAFFKMGITDTSHTLFDNVVDEYDMSGAGTSDFTQEAVVAGASAYVHSSSHKAVVGCLDDWLAVDEDSGNEKDAGAQEFCEHGEAAEVLRSPSSSSSEMEDALGNEDDEEADDLILPGIADSEGAHPTLMMVDAGCISSIRADMAEVIAEPDDCVQRFALDPLFDYDADPLGAALREHSWREA